MLPTTKGLPVYEDNCISTVQGCYFYYAPNQRHVTHNPKLVREFAIAAQNSQPQFDATKLFWKPLTITYNFCLL